MPRSSAACSSSIWPTVAAGSPGPLEKNSPSGSTASTSSMRRGGRQHVGLDAALGHHPRGVRLDAEVERGDGEAASLADAPGTTYASRGGHLVGEVGAGHLGRRAHPGEQRLGVGLGRGDADPHRSALAQVAGQRAGVDAGDADDALVAQRVVERAARAPARRHPGGVADDVAGDPDPRGLGVLVVHAGVADVGGGHHHHLAVVGRVGQRLLVAGHAGREDRLAEGLARGAVGLAAEGAAVLEDQHAGWACGCMQRHAGPPSPPHGTDR